jgi:iron complex outermembrane recepter protein
MGSIKSSRFFGVMGVSGLAIAAILGAPAVAQETGTDDEAIVLDTVLVEGQRLANQRAIDAKRNAEVISDVLAADDLNRLPDQNLAEGLARVPGLTSFQDEGAGLYVGVRGLNQEFVNVTVDGLEFSSASRTFDTNLRGANLEAVPSTFVSKVEVIKAVTPDLDGDAIAGTVNLVTRSALDADKGWLTLGASVGQYEEDVPADDVGLSTKGNISYGTTFGDDTFGLVIDANFRDINRDNLKPNAFFGSNGDGTELPEEVGGFFYQREEKSWGATAKLEFRPSQAWQSYVSANYFDSQIDIDKNKNAIFGAASDPATGAFSGGVATARNDDIEYGVDGSLTLGAGADFFITERDTISVQGSSSSSTSFQDDPRVDWFNAGPLSGTYAFNGQYFVYTFDEASQAAFDDPANYVFNGYRRFQEELEKSVDTVKLDWEHAAPDGQGLGYSAGVKWRETSVDYTASNFRWDRPAQDFDFERFLFQERYTFPDLNNPFVVMSDIAGLSAYAEELGPDAFRRRRSVITNGNDYQISEAVTAAYGLLDWSNADFRIIGGVRYEGTETEALNRLANANDGEFVNTSGSYDNWLPSVAATWFVNDNFLVRAGASQTIGRPDIRDLAKGEFTTESDTQISISRGNPDLQPRVSTNLDLSAEYYFDGGDSLISVAVFNKSIADEIFTLETLTNEQAFFGTLETPGNDRAVFISQPGNGGEATITGLEIGLIKDKLDFLPGPLANLGLSANLTLNSGDFDLIDNQGEVLRTVSPEGLSERLANTTLYYEGDRFSARAAWRYASEQTQALSLDGSSDLILDDYQQTDLQFGYKLNNRVELFGEVWNVFEDEQEFTNANLVAGPPNWFEQVRYGRALWLGVNFTY